jgi:hypothetical protein
MIVDWEILKIREKSEQRKEKREEIKDYDYIADC